MNFKNALKTAALATALAFSGASHAAITYEPVALGQVWGGGATLTDAGDVSVYSLAGTTLSDPVLAFCIQPTVPQGGGTVYTQHDNGVLSVLFPSVTGGIDRGARIHSLFEQNYASLSTGSELDQAKKRVSFQLALWDLVADDGSLTNTTGLQYVTGSSSAMALPVSDNVDPELDLTLDLAMAQQMLIQSETVATTNSYQYHWFSGVSGNNESQMLLSVSAVPEADTWAMMVVGLGLVGFMGRRKSSKAEKFAA